MKYDLDITRRTLSKPEDATRNIKRKTLNKEFSVQMENISVTAASKKISKNGYKSNEQDIIFY